MPTYEYQCSACGHQMEAFQKITDAPLTECPKCQQQALQKLVSAAGFQLKGSGWYVTDYRNKPNAKSSNDSAGEKTADNKSNGTETAASDSPKDSSSTDSTAGK